MSSGNVPGDSHAAHVRVPCIVFFALTPLFLLVRLWNRIHRRTGLGWDDCTIVLSFSCAMAVQVLMMTSCHYGFGKHIYHLSPPNMRMALKLFYVSQIFYKLTINLTKLSILFLYLRIFVQRWFRGCCYTIIAIVLSYMFATMASSIWQCNPLAGAWDKSRPYTCINLTRNWYANAGYSIATDLLILCLPMQPIWDSKLPANHKRALMLVLTLGGFVTMTSILRATTLDFSTTSPDITYDIASTLWTIIEQNVAIVCACLPMCCMILTWLCPKAFGAVGAAVPDLDDSAYAIGQKKPFTLHGSSDWRSCDSRPMRNIRRTSTYPVGAPNAGDNVDVFFLASAGSGARPPSSSPQVPEDAHCRDGKAQTI